MLGLKYLLTPKSSNVDFAHNPSRRADTSVFGKVHCFLDRRLRGCRFSPAMQ